MPTGWDKASIDRWEKGFTALSRFRAREGHCLPPRRHAENNFKLGQWVSVQRYRGDQVPAERRRRLDAIGFVWDFKAYRWEQGFAALLKFKRREGHCRVPISHNEGNHRLGWWVSTQRRRRKEMSAERKARLDKVGFVWNSEMGHAKKKAPRSFMEVRRVLPSQRRGP